jgi:2-polyprenyl-3-methyl-5-hydroxy-6-metoxy-1,4-benzoquinol methylase
MACESKSLSQLRFLVAIASYGQKNIEFLKRSIQSYRSLPMKVDVVVLSEAPKDLGDGVKVVVGLPAKDPWSLPFAHKPIFAKNIEQYDLFAYSEDDMEVTEANIQAFLRATPELAPDEIAGYLRYEVGKSGTWSLPEAHGPFHWKPESVRRRGAYTVAEFTNEHAGFYILTQSQLRRAIASGGFLRAPCQGRYGLPETAATDPYTNCGFRKVICISMLEEFLIRHMSNAYVGIYRVSLVSFKEQVQTLMDIRDGVHPASSLREVESKLLHGRWSKDYYEKPIAELLSLVPCDAKQILSVGCRWGLTEAKLQERGGRVTALPLDSVIGAVAARRGIEVVYGSLEEGLEKLGAREFDCVLISNLLHLLSNPSQLIGRCCPFVGQGGVLVLGGPNFDRFGTWFLRALGVGEHRKLRTHAESGICTCGPRTLAGLLQKESLCVTEVRWLNHALLRGNGIHNRLRLGSLSAKDWVLQARR